MPTVANIGPYRFFFYSNENDEPPHIHVRQDSSLAKFWLSPVELASSSGFKARALWAIERIVREERIPFLEAWNDFFDS